MASASWSAGKARGCVVSPRAATDWSDRFPAIVSAASRLKPSSFLIDGEAVVHRPDGLTDFNALRSRRRTHEVVMIAFDLYRPEGRGLAG
jgi:bifunctional non-homologous end joining protein LigD